MSGRPKDLVWEHGDNLALGWRCNYCGMQKSGGGSTRFKQHLAARGSSVLHCSRVPPPVREYFQCTGFNYLPSGINPYHSGINTLYHGIPLVTVCIGDFGLEFEFEL
jgi:hypothetical protein